jgi:hypothetical protein
MTMDATVVRTAMSTAPGAHHPTMPSTLARTGTPSPGAAGFTRDPLSGSVTDASESLQGEGVRARLARLRAGQRGDGDDDPFGDVDEQLGHPRLAAGEIAGGWPSTVQAIVNSAIHVLS